jgi:hypothetical protein
MSEKIDPREIRSALAVEDSGDRIVLLDRAGRREEFSREQRSRNICRLDRQGNVVWQVISKFDETGGPFTHLASEGGDVVAYRWDGVNYRIDPDSGYATPVSFEK